MADDLVDEAREQVAVGVDVRRAPQRLRAAEADQVDRQDPARLGERRRDRGPVEDGTAETVHEQQQRSALRSAVVDVVHRAAEVCPPRRRGRAGRLGEEVVLPRGHALILAGPDSCGCRTPACDGRDWQCGLRSGRAAPPPNQAVLAHEGHREQHPELREGRGGTVCDVVRLGRGFPPGSRPLPRGAMPSTDRSGFVGPPDAKPPPAGVGSACPADPTGVLPRPVLLRPVPHGSVGPSFPGTDNSAPQTARSEVPNCGVARLPQWAAWGFAGTTRLATRGPMVDATGRSRRGVSGSGVGERAREPSTVRPAVVQGG